MLSILSIQQAKTQIDSHIIQTPMIRMENLDPFLGCQVFLKAENMQKTHSFKLRGALNKCLHLTPEELARGVVAASSGNHGKGVAYAAKMLGIQATIVVPHSTLPAKIKGMEALGATIIKCDIKERHTIAQKLSDEKGFVLIHPYDDYDVMAGQGTIGLEIIEQLPYVDVVVVPIGGGGLISGIATAIKSINPNIKIMGAEPQKHPRYTKSLALGKPTEIEATSSIADALLTLKPGLRNFPIVQERVDAIFTVSDDMIIKAMQLLLEQGKILVEPSSAITIALALQNDLKVEPGSRVCFLLSGGNIGFDQLSSLLSE